MAICQYVSVKKRRSAFQGNFRLEYMFTWYNDRGSNYRGFTPSTPRLLGTTSLLLVIGSLGLLGSHDIQQESTAADTIPPLFSGLLRPRHDLDDDLDDGWMMDGWMNKSSLCHTTPGPLARPLRAHAGTHPIKGGKQFD